MEFTSLHGLEFLLFCAGVILPCATTPSPGKAGVHPEVVLVYDSARKLREVGNEAARSAK